jgi:hypothetical protein
MVFKKDITPLSKNGSVIKHSGKGSAERQPQMLPRITGRYPKSTPAPARSPMPPMMGPLPFKEPG